MVEHLPNRYKPLGVCSVHHTSENLQVALLECLFRATFWSRNMKCFLVQKTETVLIRGSHESETKF